MNGYYCFSSMAYVLKHRHELKGAKLHIMLALIDYTNDKGQCYPSTATICASAGISASTLEKHMPELVSSGHVIVQERWREDGSRDSNLYSIPMVDVVPPISGGRVPPIIGGEVPPISGGESIYKEEDINKNITEWGFEVPTLADVVKYVYEKKWDHILDPEDFIEHYERLGWKNKQGKPVKNWKTTLYNNWVKKRLAPEPTPPNVNATKPTRDYDCE